MTNGFAHKLLRRDRPHRSPSLAFYLAGYLAAAVVPLFAIIVVVTSQYVSSKRTQTESYAKSALDDIREELDRDMASKVSAMRALATSPSLATGDFATFRLQARSLLEPEDVAIILRDPNQQQIVHTRVDPGAVLPPSRDASPTGDVFATKRPYVSNLYIAEHSKAPRVSVTVPVVIEGRVAYALSVSFALAHFTELLHRQPLPTGYHASITDRTGRIISRSARNDEFVGKSLPGFEMATKSSDRWSGTNSQGKEVMGFYRRSPLSGWLFSISVDQAVVSKPLYDSLIKLALLCGVLLLAACGLTYAVRKRLVSAFAKLGSLAGNTPGTVQPIATKISEVDFIGGVLADALTKLNLQSEQLELAKTDLETKVIERTLQLSESAAELALSNSRFEAAIEHMSHGLCMLDSEQRVVVTNERFKGIYDLSESQVRPGTTLTEILERRKAAGTYFGSDPSEDAKSMLSSKSAIQELGNGRVVRILRNPMPGGRFMTTHEDITDLKRAERDLAETKKFLDTIVENVPIAIVVKELATGKFVLANRAYETYIGMPREQIVGKTVHELYDPAVADLLDQFDLRAVAPGAGAVVNEFTTGSPGGTQRFATTTRIAVGNGERQPPLLIVIIEDVTRKKLTEQRIAYLAHHDTLTGLANRASFVDRIGEALADLREAGRGFAVHLVDLDRFKDINDSMGHPVGDELLTQIAGRLRSQLRPSDICARIGGDEFAIIQREDAAESASDLAERIIASLNAPFEIGHLQVEAGASIGIALAPQHGFAATELMKRADLALYHAKSLGRRRHAVYCEELDEDAQAKRHPERELRQAVANREFEVHFQPVFDVRSGAVCAAEALVRWRHPVKGLVPPDAFIPLAEESGLIADIGEQVMEIACQEASRWPEHIGLCVNISPKQLNGERLVDIVKSALARSGVAASRLELELTETAVIGESSQHLALLDKLKTLGCSISLDDFGMGYSCLSRLTAFRFDRIKIDKSFTQRITTSSEAAAIVVAMQTMARALGIPTTAEGVETLEQLQLLRLAGVTAVQGFLLARPGPADRLVFAEPSELSIANAS